MKGFHITPEGLISLYGNTPYEFDEYGFAEPVNKRQAVELRLMTPEGLVGSTTWLNIGYHVHYIHSGFVLGGLGVVGLVEFPPHAVQMVGEDIVVETFRLVNPEHIDHLVEQLVDLEVDVDGILRRQEVLWKYAGWKTDKEN